MGKKAFKLLKKESSFFEKLEKRIKKLKKN